MIESKLCFHADLIYHLLAHMDLENNASNLFSREYIQDIAQNKSTSITEFSLEEELSPLIDTYLRGFERLCFINFIPFCANDLEQTKGILLAQSFYSNEDKEDFLIPLLNIAEKEKDTFYLKFWTTQIEKYSNLIDNFNSYVDDKLSNFKNIFKYYNVSPNIYLSLSITQNGRAFNIKDYFTAVVPLPKNSDEFSKYFIQAFHEMTHQFTDDLIGKKISMRDGTHKLSESLAILTDFYLFQKYNSSMLKEYCTLFGISECSEEIAKEKYSIPSDLKQRMEDLIAKF